MDLSDENKRKEIKNKLIDYIFTDQMKIQKRNIIEICDNNKYINDEIKLKEFNDKSLNYFYEISRALFDSFVCELGKEKESKIIYDIINFYYLNLYKWFVKDFLDEEKIKVFILNNKEFFNKRIELYEYTFPIFCAQYMIKLDPRKDIEICIRVSTALDYLCNQNEYINNSVKNTINNYLNIELAKKAEKYKENDEIMYKYTIDEIELKKKIFSFI